MIKVTKEQLEPTNDNVIVEVDESKEFKNGIYIPNDAQSKVNANYYKGRVISKGPKVNIPLKANTIINKFAGAHVNTGTESFVKCVSESEISVIYLTKKMNKDTLYVRGPRVLVELIADNAMTEGGLYAGGINTADPRELEMQSGRIVTVGDVADGLQIGDIVSFDAYCGMEFSDDDGIVYKALNEFDIRFKTK